MGRQGIFIKEESVGACVLCIILMGECRYFVANVVAVYVTFVDRFQVIVPVERVGCHVGNPGQQLLYSGRHVDNQQGYGNDPFHLSLYAILKYTEQPC